MVAINLKGDAMTDNLRKRSTYNRISMLTLCTAVLLGATALAVPSSASAFGFGGHFGGGFANRAWGAPSFANRSFASHGFYGFGHLKQGRVVLGPLHCTKQNPCNGPPKAPPPIPGGEPCQTCIPPTIPYLW